MYVVVFCAVLCGVVCAGLSEGRRVVRYASRSSSYQCEVRGMAVTKALNVKSVGLAY